MSIWSGVKRTGLRPVVDERPEEACIEVYRYCERTEYRPLLPSQTG